MAITKERSYYRMCPDSHLIEEARNKPNTELAVALGERLAKMEAEFEEQLEEAKERAADFERDANKLDDEICELQHKIDVLELMLATRDETIEQLKEQNNV